MHRVRLYPTVAQRERLGLILDVTRQTYNALLDERRYAWTARRIVVSSKEQYAEMTALRAEDARFASVYRECQVIESVRTRYCIGWIWPTRPFSDA